MGDFFKQILSVAVIAALLFFGFQNNWIDSIVQWSDKAGEKIDSVASGESDKGNSVTPSVNPDFGEPEEKSERPYASYNENALAVLENNVAGYVEEPGYEREKFFIYSGRWNDISREESRKAGWEHFDNGKCSVRNAVLIEQGKDVRYDSNCKITSGVFADRYGKKMDNGKIEYHTSKNTKDFDIDHVVALSLAWRSGMHSADDISRNMLANDRANLVTSDKSLNRSKGDQSIDEWFPPVKSKHHCDYADRYAYVKAKYNLIVTQDELSTLKEQISQCNA